MYSITPDRSWTPWRRQAKSQSVWGDGLVEQDMAALWYRGSWEDVGIDELVYLLPQLNPSMCGHVGLIETLRRQLDQQKRIADELLSDTCDRGPTSTLLTAAMSAASLEPCRASQSRRLGAELRIALAAVHHLSGMLTFANGMIGKKACVGLAEPMSSSEALMKSIHSCINAAYVYPDFAYCHELLATGAWLGHLMRGREAYLPPFIAECLSDYLQSSHQGIGQSRDASAALLSAYAEAIVGTRYLLSVSLSVCKRRHIVKIKPRTQPMAIHDIICKSSSDETILSNRI